MSYSPTGGPKPEEEMNPDPDWTPDPGWTYPWTSVYDSEDDAAGYVMTEIVDSAGEVIGIETKETIKLPYGDDCACSDCQKDKLALESLKAEVKEKLEKKQSLDDKKKIASQYLEEQEKKQSIPKKGGNPLLIVKPTIMKLPKSVPGSSHDKSGQYGGQSSYTDDDVAQARAYMQTVLGVDGMLVNGRALEHILAEIYGFSRRDSAKTIAELSSQLGKGASLEVKIAQYRKTIDGQEKRISELQAKIEENSKYVEVAKNIDKGTVAETNTGRRIKE